MSSPRRRGPHFRNRGQTPIVFRLFLALPAWGANPVKDKATWLDMRASELIGKRVAGIEGKPLGKVEDLIIDTKGAHIPHVVLSFEGDKLFVFPVNAFTRDEYRDRILLKAEPRQLEERASDLRGKNVELKDGRRGEIEDVIVNLGSGKVTGVVVAQDGRKGPQDKLTLPPGSLARGKAK